MGRHSAFGAESCLKRIKHGAERFDAVCKALAEIAAARAETPDLTGEPPQHQLVKMWEMLPWALVGRALAEEAICLIEQVKWDLYICNDDADAVRNPDHSRLASGLDDLENFMESRRSYLEQFRNDMTTFIQTTMDAKKHLGDYAERLRDIIKHIERGGA